MSRPSPENCAACPAHNVSNLPRLGIEMENWDFVVALAGNPNTGKSTVFNALTGLRQHTGNWPGKTVSRAEGGFASGDHRYKLVDLPGTYSLLSSNYDEEIARDFILFGQPDVTVIVVDANRLERNLNLVLQILEITDRAVLCLNLMDEAERHGLKVDARSLDGDRGIGKAVRDGSLMQLVRTEGTDAADERTTPDTDELFALTSELRRQVGRHFHQAIVESTYAEAGNIADRAVTRSGEKPRATFDRTLDRLVTSRIFGVPLMLAMLTGVFWLTVAGANVPSAMLASLLVDQGHGWLKELSASRGVVWWLDGLLIDGVYLSTAWVVSVMLPPVAIFFPLFTLLEDFGYLPRVAFNLDNVFRRSGAHGKQALTMAMGITFCFFVAQVWRVFTG